MFARKLNLSSLQKKIRTFKNIIAFYKSTLAINVLLSLSGFFFGGFAEVILMFISFGFVVSVAIKEVKAKEEYLFYYNNGLTRASLWIYSVCINLFVAIVSSCVYVFIFNGK